MKSQQNKGKHDTSMINRRRKEKKCDSLWCPPGPSPGGQIIPRWNGRPPPTFQCGTGLLYTSFPPPPPPPLPPQHALAVATPYISRLSPPTLSPSARSPPCYASCRRRNLFLPVPGERIGGPLPYFFNAAVPSCCCCRGCLED